ncbi:phage tail protein [Escherichia coli O74]|nr:phage tail protein [Escherichia coli O74]
MNGLILTTSGAAEIEAAYQNGQTVTVRHVLLGDGGGRALPSTPDEMAAMTSLYGEFGQEPFSDGAVEEGFISGDIVIDCKSYPGKTLRELGMISDRGTLIAYGRYPDTFLPDQTDSVIKEVILTLVLGLTHAQNVVLEVDPDRAIITQEIGDRRYLQRKKNLSDVEDKDEAVENLGLKPTVDKAKNAVQRDGDTMTGELKIRGVNALRIFNEAFGLIFRRSEECLHLIPTQENQGENGDIGPLRPFTMNLRTGEITMSKISVGGDSQVRGALGIGVQNALGGNSIAFGDNDTGIKQNGDGLLDIYANGQRIFRFQNGTLQSNRAVNVSGRVTPTDYGNFDERYQTKTGGVQNFQYTSEVFHKPAGNQVSWVFRAPSGCTLSGINVQETGSNSADNIGGVYYKQAQIYINGAWRSVSG